MSTHIHTTARILGLCLLSAPLMGQPANEKPDEHESDESAIVEDGRSVQWSLRGDTVFSDETDFNDGSGSLKAWETGLGINGEMDLGEGRLNLGLHAQYTDYEFSSTSGNTFDDVTSLTLSTMYRGRLNDTDSWFIGGSVNSAYETGAQFDDSISGGVFGGYRHQVNDRFTIGIGLVVRTRLEDDVLILPLPQVRYDMGNGWTLESRRVGLAMMYAMNDSLSFGVSGEYESTSFRLDDANTVSAGAVTQTRVPVGFEIQYKPRSNFRVFGRIGAAFATEYEFFDAAGNTVSQRDLDTGIFFGFGGSFTF